MTNSASTKLRAIGSVSAFALSAGLSTVAFAQTVPDPVNAVIPPPLPVAPGNVEECVVDNMATPGTVVCAPGTDADGIVDPLSNGLLTVEDGAQVQGEINLGDNIDATIDGDLVVLTGDNALQLGNGANVVINGDVVGGPTPGGIVEVGSDSSVTNNGQVFFGGTNRTVGIQVGANSVVTNTNLVSLTGNRNQGINGTEVGVSVINSGSILINNTSSGFDSRGVRVGEQGSVVNDGLIQTFGINSTAVEVAGDNGSVTNNGTIVTSGSGGNGIVTGKSGTIVNGENGRIFTSGAGSFGVGFGDDTTLTNDGIITTQGAGAIAVFGQDDITFINGATGQIGTTGAGGDAVFADEDATITNAGLIQATGDGSRGIVADDGLTLVNSGVITAQGSAVATTVGAAITNAEGGAINTLGDADTIDAGASASITNAGNIVASGAGNAISLGANGTVVNSGMGVISTGGDGGIAIAAGDGFTLTNDAQITTTGAGTAAVSAGANAMISNSGAVLSEGVSGLGFTVGDGATIANAAGGTITTTGDNGFGVVVNGNGVIDNDGIIAVSGADAQAVTVTGEATLTNDGTIAASGGRAVDVALASTITNGEMGVIASSGGNAIRMNASGSTTSNAGEITTTGDDNIAILGADMTTVDNSGTISTTGEDADAIEIGDGATILNASMATITATGDDARAIEAGDGLMLTNSGTIESADRALNADDDVTITNEMGGLINTTGDADTIQTGDNTTIVNNGTISNEGFDTKIIDAGDNLTVTNNGTITSDWKGVEGEANFTLTNNEGALIFSTNDEAVEADDAGLVVVNHGEIISPKDDAVDGGADVTITNTGLIRGGENDGLELDSGTITNSGIIESLSSDPNGDFSDAGLTNRELDAGIDFDGVDDPANLAGPATDTVFNLSGGIIRGDIGINASSGNFVDDGEGGSEAGSPANVRSQTIVNEGTISGNIVNPVTGRMDAVLLSGGDDTFIQLNDGVQNGWVDGEGGNDVFAYLITDQTDREFDLGAQIAGFEDVRVGTQSFDFVNGVETMTPATGLVTLTGTGNGPITIVNAAILAGTVNGSVDIVSGFGDGVISGLTIEETGVISTTGNGEIGFEGGDGATLANSGQITTTGANTAAVLVGADGTVTNAGGIRSEGVNGVGVVAGNGSSVTNVAGATITTIGDNGFGVVINGDGSVDNQGIIAVSGAGAQAVTISGEALVLNSGTIAAAGGRAVDVALASTIANSETGVIASSGGNAIRMNADGSTTSNAGTISTTGDGNTAIAGVDMSTVNNSGSVTSAGSGLATIQLGDMSTLNNQGAIGSAGDSSVTVSLGDGATILNANEGAITSSGDGSPTIVIAGNGAITNDAVISATGAGSQAVTVTGDLTLANTGTISAADGRALDVAGVATITNEAGATISATGADAIRFNSGSSLTNRGAVSGDTGVVGSIEGDTVVNFGSVTGADLGMGADEFQQWTGASVAGDVALGGGDDLFILEGTSSSVTGSVDGGMGADTAILAGDLDSDNIIGFETVQLGSALGDTLNDLDITGNRTITGDVVHAGVVNVDLGVDSLTTSGSITLEAGGVLNIGTPLDEALLGQSVLVFDDGTGFTNNGATINIDDDDLLLDYTPVVGSLRVNVSAADVLAGNADANLAAASSAVALGINERRIDATTFASLNALPDATSYAAALNDALPSLSDGVAREIFETGSLAGQELDHHLKTEGSGVWGQIAVRSAEQDARSATVDGYESDQTVMTIGGDMALGTNLRVGFMASYADIEVEDETAAGVETSEQDVESIRLGAYAGATIGDGFFVNAEASYLTGEVEANRNGFFGSIASAYDFDGFAGRFVVGYDLMAGGDFSVIPTIGVNAATISFDDATEAGGLGFTIDRDDANFVEGRLGLELGGNVSETISGFVQGVYVHDFLEDARLLNVQSAQTGAFALMPALREQDRYELSAGANIDVSETFTIGLGYLGDFASGYDAHSARANVRIAF